MRQGREQCHVNVESYPSTVRLGGRGGGDSSKGQGETSRLREGKKQEPQERAQHANSTCAEKAAQNSAEIKAKEARENISAATVLLPNDCIVRRSLA